MEEKRVKVNNKKPRIAVLACLFMLTAIFGIGLAGNCREVKAESGTEKIMFQDNSGRYLKKSGANWCLRDVKNKKITGLQYLAIPETDFLHRGIYMFDSNGRLIQKRVVYYFKNLTVRGITFQGYYVSDPNGRFTKGEKGLVKIADQKVNGKVFGGYYYAGDRGKLNGKTYVRYMKQRKLYGMTLKRGYYYFNGMGKMCFGTHFHKLNITVNGKKFNGSYYFGSGNGRLTQKAGWITYRSRKYYIDKNGKMATNCWKSGYYLKSDGTIAKTTKTPDGQYVDWQGRKSTKSEYKLSAFKAEMEHFASAYGGNWSIYIKDLKTGNIVNVNDQAMYPASTIKAFVMASTYDQIRQGKMQYSSSVRNLLWDMITVSDNESYNELVRRHGGGSFVKGTAVVNQYLKKNGYTRTGCHSSLHPSSSSWASDGGRNTASAKDCGKLLEQIYRGKCVSKQYSREMLNLLLHQTVRYKIPAGLPSGVVCANKTGETSSVQHDIAIIYGKKTDYVLCVFSSGASEGHLQSGIRAVSTRVYEYMNANH